MTRTLRPVGNVGLAAATALIILNLAHPFDGTTEMYGDAVLFISKMDTWWVIDHLGLAVAFLFFPGLPGPGCRLFRMAWPGFGDGWDG